MRYITRYVLSEMLAVFFVTLTGMTALLLLVVVAQEAVRQGLGPEPVIRLVPYALPNALRFAIPGTILFAACSVFGRMSASNEVMAIKSAGVSPMAMVWPALALSFVISLVAVWLNDLAVSWGRKGAHRVVLQSVEQIAYGMLRTHHSYSTRRFSITVKEVNGRKLVRPLLTFHAAEESPPFVVTAEGAQLRLNLEKNTLSIVMENGVVEWGDKVEGVFPDRYEQEVPLSAASREGEMTEGPSDCALRNIRREIAEQRGEIQRLEQSLAVEAAYPMMTGDFDGLTGDEWVGRRQQLEQAKTRLARLHTEPWRRWANGFSCFFFVLVGAPLAIRLRTADVWSSFGVCFLPILSTYYPLLMCAVDRAKCGELPPYAVWLGNVILCALGCWLLRKTIRH
jgi:lipopolysaccharide export system permease protein